MAAGSLETIFEALERAGARYLVVGGVAVVLHGHPRLTADLDLVLALDPANVRRAPGALRELGYAPRVPVDAEGLADPATREEWARSEGMTVFTLASSEHPMTEVHLFVEEPFPFEEARARALRADLGSVHVWAAGLRDLIAMKRASAALATSRMFASSRRLRTSSATAMADEGTTPREWSDRELVRERRRAWLALGPRARLAWLEEAKRFAARALAAAAERRRGRAVSREPRR